MAGLELRDVCYAYRTRQGTVQAVDGISHHFEPGRFYAIVGKSGCGKSTLLALMAGLDLPQSGEICFDGQSLAQLNRDRYRQRHVSLIYQSYNLLPLLTVTENVLYPQRIAGIPKAKALARAEEYLGKVGLSPGQRRRLPGTLSGGEQQRVAIARALAMETDILLADEPTGNLDSENGDAIVNLLKQVAHSFGRLVIMVTHDRDISAQADLLLPMRDGRWLPDA